MTCSIYLFLIVCFPSFLFFPPVTCFFALMVSLYVDTLMTPSCPPTHSITACFFISFCCLPTPLPLTSWVSWPLGLSPDKLARLGAVTPPLPAPSQSEVLPLGDSCPVSSRGTLLSSSTGVGLTLIPALGCPEGEVGVRDIRGQVWPQEQPAFVLGGGNHIPRGLRPSSWGRGQAHHPYLLFYLKKILIGNRY